MTVEPVLNDRIPQGCKRKENEPENAPDRRREDAVEPVGEKPEANHGDSRKEKSD